MQLQLDFHVEYQQTGCACKQQCKVNIFLIFFKQNLLKHQRRSQRILASINKKEPHNSITVIESKKKNVSFNAITSNTRF